MKRTGLYAAAIVSGGLVMAILALLLLTALTRSEILAWITGGLALVSIAAGIVVVVILAEQLRARADRSATRASNVERRLETLTRALDERDARLHELQGELDAVRAETVEAHAGRASRVDVLLGRVDQLEATVSEIDVRVLEKALDAMREQLSSTRSALVDELRAVDERTMSGLEDLASVRETAAAAWGLGERTALQLGRHPRSFLTVQQAVALFRGHLEGEEYLEAIPYIRNYGVLQRIDLATLRTLYRFYKSVGYWDVAALTLRKVAEKSGRPGDRRAVAKIEDDIAVFSAPERIGTELTPAAAHSATGPILHMVGRSLPDTQSGYTLRTQYTARSQRRMGLPVVVVSQSGIIDDGAETATHHVHEGIDYYRLPGKLRKELTLSAWLRHEMEQLGALVRELRPSVLHAHSDFQNALIVNAVGKAYGIPTVYETRGFWEESWMTRTIASNGWTQDADSIFAAFGTPAAYGLRRHAEEVARTLPDHVFTLADVMSEHILRSSEGDLSPEDVTVVPNAVDSDEFPVQGPDRDLARELGIPDGAVTVGYISSIVEYESIETLVDGFAIAAERTDLQLCLLLVGDGKHRAVIEEHVARIGAPYVIFTGAVPHEDILRYYGLIDIFVVPRRKSSVADLVTPLKPFEAFATGRAVILSDVGALREIAEQSGVAETFHAGHPRDLARRIAALADDPQRRRDLGARASRWVRSRRTWERNVAEYYRVYRELGYRGAAGPELEASVADRASSQEGRVSERSPRAGVHRPAGDSGDDGDGAGGRALLVRHRRDRAERAVTAGDRLPGTGRRAVVVAMKPQIAGRIRRNIITLLELGFEVTVVNSTPRADFFQGLRHPLLSADFIEVRSLAVRYQARMTRRKNERKARWDEEKKARALAPRRPVVEAPPWMASDVPGMTLLHRAWISEDVLGVRARFDQARKDAEKRFTRFRNTSRNRRDLAIRDQLKQVHLVNRFIEFWRLSPERIAAHHPDLIVSSDLPGLVGANVAARRLGVPHLHDCHELYLESTTLRPYERSVLWPVEKAYLRRADAVVVVNETIRDEYERRYGVHGTVLRNAAPAVSEGIRRDPQDIRHLAGIPHDAKVVLYQGGLVPGRGLDVCVRAAAHFPPDVHLVLIGRGKSADELAELVAQLGLLDRVHFLPAVEPGDLPAYTAAADVGVIPYQPVSRNNEYALPNKVFEYTGAGIPFAASDLPELRRIARDHGCGEVYDPFDPEGLAAAVTTILDPENYSTYRDSAATFGRTNTWEQEREILVGEIVRLVSPADDRGASSSPASR